MSSPAKLRLVTNEEKDCRMAGADSEARIEDSLDGLCAPLVGIVPYAERMAFRQEAQGHLLDLYHDYRYQGMAAEEATEAALREFGDPWQIGCAFLEEWSQGTPSRPPAVLIRRATWTAFAWFGLASMLNLLLLEHSLLTSPYGGWLPLVCLLALLSPTVAGCLTALITPAQSAKGVRNAVLILTLHSFVTGLLLLPSPDGLLFALWQAACWLPVGRSAAVLTVFCVRHYQRRRYWLSTR